LNQKVELWGLPAAVDHGGDPTSPGIEKRFGFCWSYFAGPCRPLISQCFQNRALSRRLKGSTTGGADAARTIALALPALFGLGLYGLIQSIILLVEFWI
jgi:hypothetical protein